ncbi:hypothetical protein BC832DRAFT_2004 [Gaertneriomyces semiglobifer]|nr:hypothetical protein BC832DRAFT_2004 [Gaertneriomyces semiglobifer]
MLRAGQQEAFSPPLAAAVGFCALLTICFVGVLYVASRDVPGELDRNDPRVIRRRLIAASVVSVLSILVTHAGLWATSKDTTAALLPSPSRLQVELTASLSALVLVGILFLGPLTVEYAAGELRPTRIFARLKSSIPQVTTWRNYIVGPATEEIVFRACMVPVLHAAGASKTAIVFGAPLFFGIAHAHHGYELFHRLGATRDILTKVIASCAFQFAYTTLFGWYATLLLMRTGSILAPIVSHMFCNFMGVPAFDEIDDYPRYSKLIKAAYISGLVLFAALLFPLTDPALFRASHYWSPPI